MQREVGRAKAVLRRLCLMPVRVDERRKARLVEAARSSSVSFTSTQPRLSRNCASVRPPMISDVTAGPAEQPGQRDLRRRDLVRFADRDQFVDDFPERILVAHRRLAPARDLAGSLRLGLVAAILAAEQPSGDRRPRQNRELLVDRDGNELVFGLARLQRIVNLL